MYSCILKRWTPNLTIDWQTFRFHSRRQCQCDTMISSVDRHSIRSSRLMIDFEVSLSALQLQILFPPITINEWLFELFPGILLTGMTIKQLKLIPFVTYKRPEIIELLDRPLDKLFGRNIQWTEWGKNEQHWLVAKN